MASALVGLLEEGEPRCPAKELPPLLMDGTLDDRFETLVNHSARRDRIAALRGPLSFSYWNALREHEQLSKEAATRTLLGAVRALLENP